MAHRMMLRRVGRYPGAQCVRQENRGLAGARNAGFRASSGEYVLFLDADDRLTPNAVEAHLCCFEKHPETGFVVGDIDHISLDGSYAGSPRWPMLEANHYEELLKINHVANTIAVMFRRSVIERLDGFKASCSPAEDYELLLRAARLFSSAHHRNVVAQYRRHPASLSRKGTAMLWAMDRVMEMQLPTLNGNPRLKTAWRQGERYWRDRFGPTTIKQLYAHLRGGEIGGAALAAAALLRYVRGRLLVFPWIYRQQALDYVRRRLRKPRRREEQPASTVVSR
jgi:glycosyltransferase involved in cell wall biosynthesis